MILQEVDDIKKTIDCFQQFTLNPKSIKSTNQILYMQTHIYRHQDKTKQKKSSTVNEWSILTVTKTHRGDKLTVENSVSSNFKWICCSNKTSRVIFPHFITTWSSSPPPPHSFVFSLWTTQQLSSTCICLFVRWFCDPTVQQSYRSPGTVSRVFKFILKHVMLQKMRLHVANLVRQAPG